MSYAQQLLTDCLVAQGLDPDAASRAVVAVLGAAVAADLISSSRLEVWERDAKIYHLRGQRVTCVDLAVRFSIDQRQVFRAIRAHMKRRRAALGLTA